MDQHFTSLRQKNIGLPVGKRLENIEDQSDLHSSLFESERGTRTRANSALHERFDEQNKRFSSQDQRLIRLERLAWGLMGAFVFMNFIPALSHLVKSLITK